MAAYAIPNEIMVGTLTLPKFLAEHFAKKHNGDIRSEGLIEAIEEADLKVPMVEITFIDAELLPEYVKQLVNCQIPFHYNFTMYEDVEFDFYYGLDAPSHIQGSDSSQNDWAVYRPLVDEAVLNSNLQKLVTQFKLLGNDIDTLLQTREILDYDFSK